jgi:hypothetical protein
MTTTTWDALQVKKNQLIRKALDGSVFTAPYTATAITALTSGASSLLQTLPVGYTDLGQLTNDGAQYSRSIDVSNVESWGSTDPSRTDITKDTTTMKVTCQETKLQTIGLYLNIDVSTPPTTDATTKELVIAAPSTPPQINYRVLQISQDLYNNLPIYIGRFWPRAEVTGFEDQKHAKGDAALEYGVTLTALVDTTLGFAQKYFWGGAGWAALLTDMNLT